MFKKGDRVIFNGKFNEDIGCKAEVGKSYYITESTRDTEDPAPYCLGDEKGVNLDRHWCCDEQIKLVEGK